MPQREGESMSGFSAGWLELREGFDVAAREAALSAFDLPMLARRGRDGQGLLHVLDLGCGSGANLRALAPMLGPGQRWQLADHDPLLLAAVPGALAAWAAPRGIACAPLADAIRLVGPDWDAELRLQCIDLARSLDSLDLSAFALIGASALLDLVSAPWLDVLLRRARDAGSSLLFGLSVDGRLDWLPAVHGDAEVARLFAAHQARDKGFGPALGAAAVPHAAGRLRALGYQVHQAASDWWIDGAGAAPARSMLHALIDGAGAAAIEQAPGERAFVEAWTVQRLNRVEATRLRVGHLDLLATLP